MSKHLTRSKVSEEGVLWFTVEEGKQSVTVGESMAASSIREQRTGSKARPQNLQMCPSGKLRLLTLSAAFSNSATKGAGTGAYRRHCIFKLQRSIHLSFKYLFPL